MRKAKGPESADALTGAEFDRFYNRALARVKAKKGGVDTKKADARIAALNIEKLLRIHLNGFCTLFNSASDLGKKGLLHKLKMIRGRKTL
jgi:hypothetical protein